MFSTIRRWDFWEFKIEHIVRYIGSALLAELFGVIFFVTLIQLVTAHAYQYFGEPGGLNIIGTTLQSTGWALSYAVALSFSWSADGGVFSPWFAFAMIFKTAIGALYATGEKGKLMWWRVVQYVLFLLIIQPVGTGIAQLCVRLYLGPHAETYGQPISSSAFVAFPVPRWLLGIVGSSVLVFAATLLKTYTNTSIDGSTHDRKPLTKMSSIVLALLLYVIMNTTGTVTGGGELFVWNKFGGGILGSISCGSNGANPNSYNCRSRTLASLTSAKEYFAQCKFELSEICGTYDYSNTTTMFNCTDTWSTSVSLTTDLFNITSTEFDALSEPECYERTRHAYTSSKAFGGTCRLPTFTAGTSVVDGVLSSMSCLWTTADSFMHPVTGLIGMLVAFIPLIILLWSSATFGTDEMIDQYPSEPQPTFSRTAKGKRTHQMRTIKEG